VIAVWARSVGDRFAPQDDVVEATELAAAD